ncbi:MAG: pyruvate kinase, partial [Bdellovibrionales bacterium]|nr:pyruvate kinase [Bdellovibrionales bacterium]
MAKLTIDKILREGPPKDTRRTKIVATVGPASSSPATLEAMIKAGANVFRLNFSHGSYDEHAAVVKNIREVSSKVGQYVSILQDLSGPKLRISDVEKHNANLVDGATVELRSADGSLSTPKCIYVETVHPATFVKPGHRILLADGILVLEAKSVGKDVVECTVTKGGMLRSHVGINFPSSEMDLEAVTDKDLKDLAWGIEQDVDYVALSFVNNAKEILKVRDEIKRQNGDAKIIAKIERKTSLENIEEILDVSDGIMIARGDLGLEVSLEKLPVIQKILIERANYRGLPAIVATQMLQSMV